MQERLIQTRYLNPISRLAAEESRVSRMLRMERSHCILQKVNRSSFTPYPSPGQVNLPFTSLYDISFAYGVVEKLQLTTKNLTHLCSNDPVNEFHSSKDMSCFLAFDRLLDGENFKEAGALSSYYLEGRRQHSRIREFDKAYIKEETNLYLSANGHEGRPSTHVETPVTYN